jgi:hypothetical protein
MIRNFFLLLFISLNFIIFAKDDSKSLIDKYIIDKSKSVEFIKLKESGYKREKTADFISKEQLSEDIKILKYILNNGYSGKDYWTMNGIDFELMYKKIEDLKNTKNKKISVSNIEDILVESLKGIVDNHLTIYGRNRNRFFKHKDAYFADVLIEKRKNDYYVLKSKQKNIKENVKFNGSEDFLFKTLSPKGKEHFLIGKLSYENITKLNIKFNNKEIKLKLHACKLNEANFKKNKAFYLDEKHNIPIIHVTTFQANKSSELTKFVDYGKTLKNTPYFILNLYGNNGGDSRYSMQFFRNINNSDISIQGVFTELISPVTLQGQIHRYRSFKVPPPHWKEMMKRVDRLMKEQKKSSKYYWKISNHLNKNNKKGNYNGTAILLINRDVASSGELAISHSACLKKHIVIGENSAGCGIFGDVCLYILPNSKIKFQLPLKLFLIKDFYEGIGHMPDYWLDSKSPVNEILNWINNPEDYMFNLK